MAMTLSVTVRMDPAAPAEVMVQIGAELEALREPLNRVLAYRLVDELKDHFLRKNSEPNKNGWAKTGFWAQIAAATDVLQVSADGATVAIAEQRFAIQLFGGTIYPVEAQALTIPLIEAARGLRARSYEEQFGRRLFTIPGRDALFERTGAAATESVIDRTMVRVKGEKRTLSIPLAARSGIRPVYALRASVTVPADPDALPTKEQLEAALLEEGMDFIERQKLN